MRKHQKFSDILGVIERYQWHEMGSKWRRIICHHILQYTFCFYHALLQIILLEKGICLKLFAKALWEIVAKRFGLVKIKHDV